MNKKEVFEAIEKRGHKAFEESAVKDYFKKHEDYEEVLSGFQIGFKLVDEWVDEFHKKKATKEKINE